MSAMSREEIEEFRRHREWWRRPDPYDPRNAPDDEEADDQSASAASDAAQVEREGSRDEPPSPPTGRALLKENGDG